MWYLGLDPRTKKKDIGCTKTKENKQKNPKEV